ncbi:MAG: glycosyltransferase family 2 protein [Deltaproteobacteria bacterium]|nr:MAG: glycosyltransferase family 2 protein [Deltaproteobacteria bacterium]RLB24233.1 MAG: glycosyltransferase family 2 protein [Deltaproteobacteria bacterium]
MPMVSVIIPTFNRSEKVVRAVSSVLNQDFRDFEVIVVDDGSIDNTHEALSKYMSAIKYIRQSENMGVSAARNRGIKSSIAPWIAFLDSDDYWLTEKLSVQIEYIDQNPNTVACQTEEIWIKNGRRVNPKKRHKKPSGNIFTQSLKLCLVSPSSVIIKRSLFEDVGLFDETLPVAEDFDLWLRISCRHPIHLIDKGLVVKEGGHDDQLSRQFSGMDRFRIKAIVRLVESGILSQDQTSQAMEELSIKCRIYGEGCVKRGKIQEGNFYLSLPKRLDSNGEILLNSAMHSFLEE